MDRRSNNIAIFQDSMDMIKQDQKLSSSQLSIQNQKLYVPSQAIALPRIWKINLAKRLVSSKEASKPPLHTQNPESESAS